MMDFISELPDNYTTISISNKKSKKINAEKVEKKVSVSTPNEVTFSDSYLPVPYEQKEVKKENKEKDEYYHIDLIREPMVTFCITPNNAPEHIQEPFGKRTFRDFEAMNKNKMKGETDLILTTLHGLYNNFYLPDRLRLSKGRIKLKMNDVVSFKILMIDGEMKFFITVPEKWKKSFISAIHQDWGNVDITEVDNKIVEFDPNNTKAMDIHLRHHYALSLKYDDTKKDTFLSSLSSLASTLDKGDKVLIDYNIEPVNNKWKNKAHLKMKQFKEGKVASREDTYTWRGIVGKVFDVFNVIFDEFGVMIEQLMGVNEEKKKKQEQLFELQYSDKKLIPNTKGYKTQIRVLGESKDEKKVKYSFKSIETSFSLLDGDNKFTATHIKSKKGIAKTIEAVEKNEPIISKTTDILFEKELREIVKLPNKETLKEFKTTISQDTHTRSEIDEVFFEENNGAIPFGYTLDKEPKKLNMGGYEREEWNEKGRKVKDKQALDDRSTATMIFGGMGSGKTSMSENQALYTFGAHIQDKEQWKRESKSVVVFDVADGAMIKNIYNHIPDWQKDRVIVLNHSNFKNPIAINNADLDEFNTEIMKDDDYAYTLAEMEAKLVLDILKSEKTIAMDRWFTSALQCVHTINKDWGYIEAMRALTDDEFRQEEIIPHLTNKRLQLEMKSYNELASKNGVKDIVQTIQNRFSQLERDAKLWDCIAQTPIRNEDGKVKLNFRKMMDGDEDGAYMILIYIPKSGVSQLYRKFIFAHYFTKIWNVALSREVGFGGREYRPETLVIMDEIHQIIDIPLVAKLFIDIFKEPRKYSIRYWFTLHGWSSLAKAGRGLEGDIKQSIMDNGCNLIMLKGGQEAFHSLENFLQPMTLADFNNLMNMDYCGIFAIRWKNKNHVMQVKMIPDISRNKDFRKISDVDTSFLTDYNSPFGKERDIVREDNLIRSYKMIEESIKNGLNGLEENEWEELEKVGMNEKN